MKLLGAFVILLSSGFNLFQAKVISDQALLIHAPTETWKALIADPVYLHKDMASGDVYVQVPYADKPYKFASVCMPESRL